MTDRTLIADIDHIVGLDEQPVLRNLLITQCYADLAQGLGDKLGHSNANWCNFATWASKTAGNFIRAEEVPEFFRDALQEQHRFLARVEVLTARLSDLLGRPFLTLERVMDLPTAVVDQVTEQIVAGNLKVFSELGPIFSSLIHAFDDDGTLNDAKFQQLLASLRTGPSSRDGQTLLHAALTHYRDALRATDADEKAQWMLLANAQTGLHEQIRLQPYIKSSLDAPVAVAFDRLWESDAHDVAEGPIRRGLHAIIDRFAHPLVAEAEDVWCDVATDTLMTLRVPGQTLRLGRDLPPPPGLPLYPAALAEITLPELAEVMELYGALGHGEGDSGATDWARLPQRMTYIIDLFRSRQQVGSLYDPPFSERQHQAILDDQVPGGPL